MKGILNKEEVILAKQTTYLRHTHVVVATPDAMAEVLADPAPCPLMDYTKVRRLPVSLSGGPSVSRLLICWQSAAFSLAHFVGGCFSHSLTQSVTQ